MNNYPKIKDLVRTAMRITFLQTLLALVFAGVTLAHNGSSQNLPDQEISLQVQGQEFKKVLRQIEEKADVKFVFSSRLINVDQKVSVSADRKTLAEVLDNLLGPLQLSYEFSGKLIILKRKMKAESQLPGSFGEAAAVLLTGRVTSARGMGLPGVTVVVKGTTVGTSTAPDGTYSLQSPENSGVLVFSFIGMLSQEIPFSGAGTINVTLEEDTQALEEVLVVGYGTVKRSDLTGSVAQVRESEIKAMPIVALDRALQGRAAGVFVTENSSRPGGSTTVRIRGTGSVTAGNEPLYVIDGYPIGDLNTLNPMDIESIEVLKDASATAIYGSRGSNGVILVTTKRGKAGQSVVNFETYYGIQTPRRTIPLLNASEYAEFINDARVNGGGQPYFDGSTPDRPLPASLGAGTDWQDEVFQNAPIHNHQLSLNGGNEKTQYAISGSSFNQDGLIVNSFFKRYTVRTNLDHQVSKRIKVGLTMQGAFTQERRARTETGGQQDAGVTGAALNYAPVFPVFNPNGTFYRNLGTLNGQQVDNPVGISTDNYNRVFSTRILTNAFADFKIAEGLTFRTSWGANINNYKSNYYATRQTNLGFASNGDASITSGQNLNWLNENVLSYTRSFADRHNLSGVLGYTTQGFNHEFVTANASNFSDDFALYNNLGSGATLRSPSSGVVEWGLISYLTRINYGFDNRYLVTFTARADGSSRFGPNKKYGFFPSGAVAWRVINEGFMQNQNALSDLKFRASYGLSGNQEIGNYPYLSSITPVRTAFGGALQVGGAQNRVSNLDLGWEKNAQLNIGLDFGIINNRVQFTTDYYIKTTSDLLITVNIPQSSGFSTSLQNIGKVENRGVELGINSLNIDQQNFQWHTDFNISFNNNKVLNLDNARREFIGGSFANVVGYNITRVGEPLGAFYGRVVEGIFQNEGEIASSAQKNAKPGDFRFKDLNGDGVINDADRQIIGNPNPKFFGGLNNTFVYKGFDLNIFIQGTYGVDIMNFQRFETHNLNGQNNQSRDVLDRWTPANPSTTIPRANSQGGQRIFSTFHMEDGSYLRVKNIALGYTLPATATLPLGMNSLKVYVAAQNWFTLTRYTGYDPEVNFFGSGSLNQGVDYGAYPTAKTVLLGLNVRF
jgi:TonB-dependent starch-binding outer membrane protein SusC